MSAIALLAAQDAIVIAAVVVVIAFAYARHPLAIPSVIVTVLFGAHSALTSTVVMDGLGPLGSDSVILMWIIQQRSATVTTVMTVVSALGGTVGMVVVAAVACVSLLWKRRIRAAVVVAAAGGGAGALVVLVKNLLARPRPPQSWRLAVETTYSLPSGHALSSTVVLGIVAAAVVTGASRPHIGRIAILLATGIGAAIGVSRLYLAVHWPSDVVDGWLLGGAWLTVCVCALVRVEHPPGEVAASDHPAALGSDPAREDPPAGGR
ncbi:phosphatase PAP2 family protein [Pseudonocardia sp. N23]|uniref:phosphatase PAP2 family protein n=1 Tax=Pseudonocardia sp. N23 TaxID=1987376 RepID=UPI000BFC18C6|nr:phosphatase PAP2 family protein [Pseudonocardia sp. N23]GAY10936.1 membrane-associated phospholipid phosphatase [Pseudonocardia sp. N23]